MMEGKRLSNASGQVFTLIRADQAIYKLIVDNLWMDCEGQFDNVHARLGGMHNYADEYGWNRRQIYARDRTL